MLPPGSRNYSKENLPRVRALRSEASASEKIVWEFLRKDRTGFRFRRQYPLGPYVLDFYCPEAMLCVEVDGEQHLLRTEADRARDEYLSSLGIQTFRIPSLSLFEKKAGSASFWIDQIAELCRQRTSGTP